MTGNLKTGLTIGTLKIGLTTGNCKGTVVKPVFKERQGCDNFYLSLVPVMKGMTRIFFFWKNILEFSPHSLKHYTLTLTFKSRDKKSLGFNARRV